MSHWLTDVELWATLFGLASVALTIRQSVWCWPTGLVMVTLYIVVFREARLYSDMGLQVAYVGLQIYGWRHWLRPGPDRGALPVTRLTPPALLAWVATGAVATSGLGFAMATLTDADLPYWDASTTVLSLIAQWLMARKVLDSWGFWVTVDVLAVGIYAAKGLTPTAVLYGVFLVLASAGLVAWRRSWLASARPAQEPTRPSDAEAARV